MKCEAYSMDFNWIMEGSANKSLNYIKMAEPIAMKFIYIVQQLFRYTAYEQRSNLITKFMDISTIAEKNIARRPLLP